ncbi:MAG TPA: exopolysaccharide biosynthesis protein [Thauera sp.]|nr:exopolysaccharide biosynthesis protein [Thauera sp.]
MSKTATSLALADRPGLRCRIGKRAIGMIVRDENSQPSSGAESMNDKRRATVERIAGAQLASMNGTMGDALGQSNRQRVVWLGLLAMPLLFPVALPGMASAVGALSLLIAFGVLVGQPLPLPGWLARREMNGRARALLERMLGRVVNVIALWGRPRLLPLSDRPARVLNGMMLSAAGLSMMVPVPIISFDNVLPALAIVLMSWGLRLRDGLMLLGGYLVTLAAAASVLLLWWGGASAANELLSLIGLAPGQ